MNYTLQELLLANLLMGLVFTMTVAGLIHYYRKLDHSYLKHGAIALGFALLVQIVASASLLFELEAIYLGSLFFNLLYSIFAYAVLCQLGRVSFSLSSVIAVLTITLMMAGYVATTSRENSLGWMLVQVPATLMLLVGAYQVLRFRIDFGRLALVALVILHLVIRLVMASVDSNPGLLGALFFFSSLSAILSGSALILIAGEQVMDLLEQNQEKIQRFEQENRRLEMQFSQAQKHESLGMLAGGIAHDFNNMLTSILGYTSLAIKKLTPESEVRKDLYMVMSGARQAVDLTSQMLVYAGKGATEFESLDISEVVDKMSGLINSIVPRKIHLVHKIGRDLPSVKGDPVQMGQIVMNLVANAVDAIEDNVGTIEIQSGLREIDDKVLLTALFASDHEPGVYAYIRITDTGMGIAADQVERIFDPFYTDKNRGKNKSKGLGLSSISGIVRQHKGFVCVDSQLGKGSEFTVYLPVVSYRDVGEIDTGGFKYTKAQGRVLVADDDSRIRSLIVSILESASYSIVAVDDGREASEQIGRYGSSFDVFVLDCTMPKMSGPEVYKEIRAANLTTPVILVSGYHREQVVKDISRDSNAYFIKKPFGVDELLETITQAVANRKTAIRER
jgi:signal transduction histidine kinase/CheY-like chemotaxis protein